MLERVCGLLALVEGKTGSDRICRRLAFEVREVKLVELIGVEPTTS